MERQRIPKALVKEEKILSQFAARTMTNSRGKFVLAS
jgi:hypothetical protein